VPLGTLLAAVASIVVMDLVLSGDNAMVIGMAAHHLPAKQQRLAIVLGGVAAIALRVMFTIMAALLLGIPLLQAIGGLVLLWIAFKLLREEEMEDEPRIASEPTGGLGNAVRTIILADVVMSLDNILAVAGASHGNLELLIFGLCLSMPILMFGSGLVAAVIDRFPWLVYLGVFVLTWTSGRMIVHDKVVSGQIGQSPVFEPVAAVTLTLIVLGLATWQHRRARARRAPRPPEVRV
jgi:YjbE family integral membrane protein